MNRREFLKISSLGITATALSNYLPAQASTHNLDYQLAASEGLHRFIPEQEEPTKVWHYNGSIPGPLIRLQQNQESRITFHNQLKESSSVHWHGLRINNAMDGVPGMTQKAVNPGEKFIYQFTPPDAGTYWYHTHQRSWEQLARGLAGVLIVDELEPPKVDQDLVFAIDDWRVDDALQFDESSLGSLHDWAHGGRLGKVITVNGESNKEFPVSKGERVRLRLLNIANARIMKLRFNIPTVSVIAIDGQPIKPYRLIDNLVTLAPGQRADLMIDMVLDPDLESPIELLVRGKAYEVAHFKFNSSVKRENLLDHPIALPNNPVNLIKLPTEFSTFPLLMEGGAMGRMQNAIYQGKKMEIKELIEHKKIWSINGIAGLPDEPLFRVKRGTAIKLELDNNNAWPHAMHMHGHHFIDDNEPNVWRDTALYDRGEKATLKFIADNPGKWLIHCHMLEHNAGGMSTWFEVT